MKKVLILQPQSDDGCTWYRLRQFADSARQQGLIDVQFLNLSLPVEQLTEVIEKADAYLLRLSDTPSHEVFDQFNWDEIHKPIFLDIDDNYEIVDPLSDMYTVYGTKEVVLPDGTYLFKDGENINIEKNTQRLETYRKVLKKATAIFVTTFELRQYALEYNQNVVVIPNAINLSIFPQVKDENKKDEIRLLWAGGSSHYPDLAEVKDSLIRLMNRNPHLHFYIVGVPFKGIVKDLPTDRVHTFGWVKADGHGFRLACLNADIGICPLKDMEFNKKKSSVKYYEYAALRMATVAKNIPPYSDDIIDGHNGLLYSTSQEFEEKIQFLIDHPLERLSVGQQGYEYVKEKRQLDTISRDWAGFMDKVIDAFSSVKAEPSKISVIHHKNFTIEPLEGKNVLGVLHSGLKLLKKKKIPHWISSGTLLGLYRDKKIIPHDTDIDVNVCLDVHTPQEITLDGFELIRTMRYGGLLMQSAFMKDGIIFDIYYFYTGIRSGFAINYNEHGVIEKPLKFIHPIGELKYRGQMFPVPNHIEEFLEWRFGKDWKIPKKNKESWEKDATHVQLWS